jgi:hypothetical protein
MEVDLLSLFSISMEKPEPTEFFPPTSPTSTLLTSLSYSFCQNKLISVVGNNILIIILTMQADHNLILIRHGQSLFNKSFLDYLEGKQVDPSTVDW